MLLRLLASAGIPNVFRFRLGDPQLNYVALLYGKKIGERSIVESTKSKRLCKANKYLARQFKRLERYSTQDLDKFNYLAGKLLMSFAFQVQAYNSVFPRWTSVKFGTVKSHLRNVRRLCRYQSASLDYKRVWIDKSPGDFGRPLGVPTLPWRVYLRMLTNLGEIYLRGKGLYSNFQHGGRPGKGVLTCLEAMLTQMQTCDKIFEFDLKGFFDHISKESVKEFFKGTFLADLYFSILHMKPRKYELPPIHLDMSVKAWTDNSRLETAKATKDIDFRGMSHLFDPEYHEAKMFGKTYVQPQPTYVVPEIAPVETGEEVTLDMGKLDHLFKPTTFLRHLTGNRFGVPHTLNFPRYDQIMTPLHDSSPATFGKITPASLGIGVTEEERARGRDMRKDLNLADQGIPQGTSFGPMLASTIAAYHLRGIPNLLMYIDDGMVFLTEGQQSPEEEIKKALRPIEVDLAVEKSRMIEMSSLGKEGIKFLGIRAKLTRAYTTLVVSSETRRGIIKDLRGADPANFKRLIDKMNELGLLTKSKFKMLRWYLGADASKLRGLMSTESVNLAIKWGFFGNLLAEAYSPTTTPDELRELIRKGMKEAECRHLKEPSSVGCIFLSGGRTKVVDQEGMSQDIVPDLFNLSSLGCELLLKIGVKGILKPKFRGNTEMYSATIAEIRSRKD